MKRLVKNRNFSLAAILLIFVSLCSYGQNRTEKTITIINKLNLVENQKTNYKFQLEPLKYQATGNDSISLLEIEKQLTEEEILKRITSVFDETYNEGEINDIYNFIQTSAFEKLFKSGEIFKAISAKFSNIDLEIERIYNNFNEPIEKSTYKFEPISVDKEDGFYATIDYNSLINIQDKNVKLENNPSLTFKDIIEAKKTYRNSTDNKAEISITLTKEGARKFYLLTKENIGKPIAIVIERQIVSMPVVQSEIMGGKVNISGDFSEKEIDRMIETLKGK
jgi:hypothetical protein